MIDESVMAGDTVILAIDPGITTGWAITRRDGVVLGTGNFSEEVLAQGLDRIVRTTHRGGYVLDAVVELMPQVGGVGPLAIALEFVRRTIVRCLTEVYDLTITYVTPGTWKTSRSARLDEVPATWDGKPLTQHQKDAVMMARWRARQRRT